MADNLYFDNLHEQLYAEYSAIHATGSGTSDYITLGLSDFGELPGQSTWYIRSILFKIQGHAGTAVPGYTTYQIVAGIVNRDIASTPYDAIGDYQDVAGWPLKGVFTEGMVQNTLQHNNFSYQKLWKPSRNLTLNREQNINLTLRNNGGDALSSRFMMYIHAERGD